MSKNVRGGLWMAVAVAGMIVWSAAAAHAQISHQGGQQTAAAARLAAAQPQAPHGGQLATVGGLTFEVVYRPQEIRVYAYGPFPRPLSTKEVRGEVALKRPDTGQVTRLALESGTPLAGQQEYLSARGDLSGTRDAELTATVTLANVPGVGGGRASFAQSVVMSKPTVALAALDASDTARIARQQVCPVMGAKLGSMGSPVKVLVSGQPIYLCCKGCLRKVENAPDVYLQKATAGR